MRTGGRRERVAEAIRREVAGILRFELADPRIGRATVTRVELTGDLGMARVYVSVYGSEADRKETLDVLGRARGRVRTLLGSRVRLRATPEIQFVFDPSVEFSIRLEQILDRERAARPQASGDESGEGDDRGAHPLPGEDGN